MGKVKYLIFAYGVEPRKGKPDFRVDAEGVDKDGDVMMDSSELLACERGLFTPTDVVVIDAGYQVVLA